jgi:hypothetical protein
MLQAQLGLLYPLLAIFLVLTVFVLYVHYTTDRHYRLKLVLGPALLLACALAVPCVGTRLGYGWPAALPQSFEYLAHKTMLVGFEKRWIDVLLLSRSGPSPGARLHRIPWSRSMEDVLDEALRLKESGEGGDIVLTGKARPGGESGGAYPEYVPKRVLPSEAMPKDAVPPRSSPDRGPREIPGRPGSLPPHQMV